MGGGGVSKFSLTVFRHPAGLKLFSNTLIDCLKAGHLKTSRQNNSKFYLYLEFTQEFFASKERHIFL